MVKDGQSMSKPYIEHSFVSEWVSQSIGSLPIASYFYYSHAGMAHPSGLEASLVDSSRVYVAMLWTPSVAHLRVRVNIGETPTMDR